MTSAVVLWDRSEDPPEVPEEVLYWQSYSRGGRSSSVPCHLEAHAQRIRARYLAFIRELGEHRIGGRRVIDHLDPGEGFSLWWMTLVAEKSPLKSPRLYDCLRLLALEEMLVERRSDSLTLVSPDRRLAEAIDSLCRNLQMAFRWQVPARSRREWSVRSVYESLPFPLKGLLSLRHVMVRWPLRKLKKPRWFGGPDGLFICSYFIHLDAASCSQGRFHSGQWEDLPKFLADTDRPINWIQHFLFSAVVPNVATGIRWLSRFNEDALNQGCHAFLDSYLATATLLTALKRWLWLNVVSWRLRDIQAACRPAGSAACLWPLLRGDWHSSLTGPVAMSNCLWLALFDAALAELPRQQTGLYLCENQSWEKALLRAWRKHGHGRIIGVQHATVPFWHLYYFDDPRCLTADRNCALPLPDQLAVNGVSAAKAFAQAGYPVERLVEVEAVRYLSLSGRAAKHSQARPAQWANFKQPVIRVLALGDMIPVSVHHLLTLLEEAMKHLTSGFELAFKPHPGCWVDLSRYPGLEAREVRSPLGPILCEYDVAVAANSTSAAVDAYVAGLQVIVGLNPDELNLSPLRGQCGACFVSSGAEMAEALRSAGRNGAATEPGRQEFFFLDADLPRWKRLLGHGDPVRLGNSVPRSGFG